MWRLIGCCKHSGREKDELDWGSCLCTVLGWDRKGLEEFDLLEWYTMYEWCVGRGRPVAMQSWGSRRVVRISSIVQLRFSPVHVACETGVCGVGCMIEIRRAWKT